jgi:hypothetical protein
MLEPAVLAACSSTLQIRSGEPQTLHLVLRDQSDARPPASSTPTPSSTGPSLPLPHQGQPTTASHGASQAHAHQHLHQHQHQHRHHIPHGPFAQAQHARPGQQPAHNLPFGFQQPPFGVTPTGPPGSLPFGFPPQQFIQQQLAQQQQLLAQQQQLFAQHHHQRQSASPLQPGTSTTVNADGTRVAIQSDGTRRVTQEGVGPQGQWRITVNETIGTPRGSQRTGSPFSAADMQNRRMPPPGTSQQARSTPTPAGQPNADWENIMRADPGRDASRILADALRRNPSSSSLMNLANPQATQPIPPGVTTPLVPSRVGSAAGTPDPIRAASRGNAAAAAPATPEVYILSSPEGPRALLVSSDFGNYTTPRSQPLVRQQYHLQHVLPYPLHGAPLFPTLPPPQVQHQFGTNPLGTPVDNAANQIQQQQQPQGLPPLPQAQPQQVHVVAPQAHNVEVRAIAIANIWPHIWMVIRLMLFIWWFTSPTASWQRWFTVSAIAFTLFLVNTGLLNPLAEQVWTPIRRHIENLLPMADHHVRERPMEAANAHGNTADQGQRQQPNPADVAARLVQDRRRANANWLMTQVRRLERAGILFLASIAPGVAERHIAHLEAEARAERQRREAAEAAAAEAARAAEENQDQQNAEAPEGASTENTGPEQTGDGEEAANAAPQGAAEEPLIAI